MATLDGKQMLARLEASLSESGTAVLDDIARGAAASNVAAFLVGGAVRDLALGLPHVDLDVAVEGEVAALAAELAASLGGQAVNHPRFGTASVRGKSFHFDLASTRAESYPRPGALPEVRRAALAQDLARRDFTINAVALRLTHPRGEILDPFSGLDDLASSRLRVLHESSFQDDSTRILRGLRYATRFRFGFEEETQRWMERDLGYLAAVSGPRLRRELALLFQEPAASLGLLSARDLGVLAAIDRHLTVRDEVMQRWQESFDRPPAPLDEAGFCLIAGDSTAEGSNAVSRRLHLAGKIDKALADLFSLRRRFGTASLDTDAPTSLVDELDRHRPAAVWAFGLLAGGNTHAVCIEYLERWRHIRPRLSGDDLLRLGLRPGPEVGETLKQLRQEILGGRVSTRADEEKVVRRSAARTKKTRGGRNVRGRQAGN